MSNPTELPDLDRLQGLAQVAKDAGIPLCADLVLDEIALARRAQPEGEAPQAVAPPRRLSEEHVWETVKRHAHGWTVRQYAQFDGEGLDAFAIELMDSQRAAQLDGGQEGSESNG